MENKCIECENETMLKYSSLYCDYENALDLIKLLEENLKATRSLCDFYGNKCNMLEGLVKLYKEKYDELEKKNG